MPGWSLFKTLGCTVDACTADGDSETPFSEPIPARGHASLGPAADTDYLEEEAALTRARANTTAGPTVMVSTEEVTTDFRGHVVLTMDLDAKIRAELEPEPEIETKEQRKKKIARESTLATVVQDGDSLFDAPAALKADKEVVLAAVTQYGCALRHASPKLKGDLDIVRAAVKQDGHALMYAARELRADHSFLNDLGVV